MAPSHVEANIFRQAAVHPACPHWPQQPCEPRRLPVLSAEPDKGILGSLTSQSLGDHPKHGLTKWGLQNGCVLLAPKLRNQHLKVFDLCRTSGARVGTCLLHSGQLFDGSLRSRSQSFGFGANFLDRLFKHRFFFASNRKLTLRQACLV